MKQNTAAMIAIHISSPREKIASRMNIGIRAHSQSVGAHTRRGIATSLIEKRLKYKC